MSTLFLSFSLSFESACFILHVKNCMRNWIDAHSQDYHFLALARHQLFQTDSHSVLTWIFTILHEIKWLKKTETENAPGFRKIKGVPLNKKKSSSFFHNNLFVMIPPSNQIPCIIGTGTGTLRGDAKKIKWLLKRSNHFIKSNYNAYCCCCHWRCVRMHFNSKCS